MPLTKSSIKTATLLASAARTATATGTAMTTSMANLPITAQNNGFSRHMNVFLNVSAFTSGTLDLTIEGSLDNVTWFTLTPSAAWTQVTAAGKQTRRYEGPLPPFVRAVGTAASTPVFTYDVSAVMGG